MNKQMMRVGYGVMLFMWVGITFAGLQIPIAKKITELSADFNQPSDIASDAKGLLYVLDGMNSQVVIFSRSGQQINVIKTANTAHSFYQAMALAVEQGIVYIADTVQHRIRCFSLQGKWLGDISLAAPAPNPEDKKENNSARALPEPVSLLIKEGELIYADRRWHRVCFLER